MYAGREWMKSVHTMFNRRVVIISGKGGVGKSTVTAALAALAARQGKRVLVVELAGQCAMAQLLGGETAGYEVVRRRKKLHTLSVTPRESMEEYLTREMHSKRLYRLVFKNDYVGPFIAAVPGLEDLVSIGKIMDLERAVTSKGHPVWDLIMVDAPATGQGMNLLRVPKAMMDMTRMGPFFQNTKLIQDMLQDPKKTVLNLVTLPEEMPINETIEMYQQVRKELNIPLGYMIVNHLRPQPFTSSEHRVLKELASVTKGGTTSQTAAIQAVLRTAREVNRRAMHERAYVTRISSRIPLPLIELPMLPHRNVEPEEVEQLADNLSQDMSARELH